MLTLSFPEKTPLHSIKVGKKLFVLVLFTTTLFWVSNPFFLSAALGLLIGLYLICGWRMALYGLRQLWPLVPFVVIVALWHVFSGSYAGGVEVILRMLTAVAAANLVTMTSSLSDMSATFEKIMSPFSKVLPTRHIVLAITLTIRFIPVMSQRMHQISDALRARSGRFWGWRVFAPSVLAALDDAEHVADALRARSGWD